MGTGSGAALTTSTAYLGNACLDVTATGAYIYSDNGTAMGVINDTRAFGIECRMRQPALVDSIICGKQNTTGTPTTFIYAWQFGIHSSALEFSAYQIKTT